MDFEKIMWISDLLENSVLNGCLSVLKKKKKFMGLCYWMWVCVLVIFVEYTYLDLNSYGF